MTSMQAAGHQVGRTASPPTDTTPVPIVAVRAVTKQFGSVVALRDITLEAYPSRVLALLGDNGAGKSTLIKILSGVYQPTAGHVEVNGVRTVLHNPHVARELGISTVFQDLAVCELLSISRNLVLGNEPRRTLGPFHWLDVKASERIAREALATLGVELRRDMADPAGTLSGGQRQAVAIARAIYYGSKCLILDEPTAALAVRQTEQVLDQVRSAREAGQAVILITHNLEQALSVADSAVVLARGRIVGSFDDPRSQTEEITHLVMKG